MDPSLLITKKAILLKNLAFYNALKTWAIDNGSNGRPFTIQGNSNLQRKGFILDDLALS